MRIIKVILSCGLWEKTTIDFTNRTLICSDDNSSGKTSLVRFILYSLGFEIPSTKGLQMKKFDTEVYLELNSKVYSIVTGPNMHGYKIFNFSNKSEMYLSNVLELHSFIFDIKNKRLIQNILGVFYIDQEHGLMNWNKGTVIGDNVFKIRDFLVGVSNIDLSKEYGTLGELKKEREKYMAFSQFKQKTSDHRREYNIKKTEKDELLKLENKKSYLKYNAADISRKIIEFENMLKDNKSISDFVHNMKILIKRNKDETPFILKQSDILNLEESNDWLEANILELKEKVLELKEEIAAIDFKISKKKTLFDDFVSSTIDEVAKKTNEIQITDGQISSVIDSIKVKIDAIEIKIEETIKSESAKNIKFIVNKVDKYVKLLLPTDRISYDSIEQLLFLKRNDKYSGRILSHLSYAFHLAYISLIRECFGTKLPIIIDSPTGKEMTIENFEKVLRIIDEEFEEHNLIIASIYKYDSPSLKKIQLIDKLFAKNYYKAE